MREIKFRAYDEQQQIMHLDFEFISSGEEHNDWIIFKSNKQQLKDKAVFDNPYFYKQFKIMQYTGLKDKNGVDIYEGDIIGFDMDTSYKRIFIVIYDSGRFGIQTDEGFRCLSDWTTIQKYNNTISCEVIGNIYEHPELLLEKLIFIGV